MTPQRAGDHSLAAGAAVRPGLTCARRRGAWGSIRHLRPPRPLLSPQTEDGLLHIQWFERSETDCKAEPETDTIVFPDEAHFQKVPHAHCVCQLLGAKSPPAWSRHLSLATADHATTARTMQAGKGPQRVYVLKFAHEADRNQFFW
jgi:hypothetical protein